MQGNGPPGLLARRVERQPRPTWSLPRASPPGVAVVLDAAAFAGELEEAECLHEPFSEGMECVGSI